MASTGKNNGTLTTIYLNGDAVAHSTNASLSNSMETRDITTKSSGGNRELAEGVRMMALSGDCFFAEDAGYGVEDLFYALDNRQEIAWKYTSAVAGDKEYRAVGYLTSLERADSVEDNAGFSFSVEGTEILTEDTFTGINWETDPLVFLNLDVAEIDSTDTNQVSSGAVAKWYDKSPQTHLHQQSTAGSRPTYASDGVTGDGTADYLNGGSFNSYDPFSDTFTLVVRFKRSATPVATETIWGTNLLALRMDTNGKLQVWVWPSGGTSAKWRSNASVADNTWKNFIIEVNQADGQIYVWDENGTAVSDDGVQTGALAAQDLADFAGVTTFLPLFARNNAGTIDQYSSVQVAKFKGYAAATTSDLRTQMGLELTT